MNYIVYKTTNIINNKIYIGVHRTNPDIFDGYIGCGVTKKDQKKKINKGLPAAVKKYGYQNFKRETLFIFEDSEEGKRLAYEKEAELVNVEFVKRIDTYNLSVGGVSPDTSFICRKISQYTLDGKFIRTWDSIEEASQKLNLTALRSCVCGKTKCCGDWQWRYSDLQIIELPPVIKKEKSVFQFDLSGNLIKSWKSISEAAKQFINQSAKTAIWNVCNKKARQSFGYFWSYKNKFEYVPYVGVAVAKYNDSGEFLESYTSIKEAATQNNIKTESNIIAAIKGLQKRCGGFRWRYFYGNTSKIKAI